MPERLPLEIMLFILDTLQLLTLKPALAAFCQVSKVYQVEATKRLYSTIAYTRTSGAMMVLDLFCFLPLNSSTFIQEFVYYSSSPFGRLPSRPSITICQISIMLQCMPNLRVVRFHGLRLVPCPRSLFAFGPRMCWRYTVHRPLQRLELLNISVTRNWTHPLVLLKCFSDVESSIMITLCTTDLQTVPQDIVAHLATFKAKVFAVALCPFNCSAIPVYRVITPPSRVLELYDMDGYDVDVVNHYIASAGSQLETLRIRFKEPLESNPHRSETRWVKRIIMSSSVSLRHVSIILSLNSASMHSAYVVALMSCLPPHVLSVDIAFPLWNHNQTRGRRHLRTIHWDSIASCIPATSGLNQITFTWLPYGRAESGDWSPMLCRKIQASFATSHVKDVTIRFNVDRSRAFYERDGYRRFEMDGDDWYNAIYNPSKIDIDLC